MLEERAIRELLTRTWYPFFGRFGRLRPIQLQAIPPILQGHNVLLGSRTASGKTEAMVAPVLERAWQQSRERYKSVDHLMAVLVAPTRALCNDLQRRLANPVQGAEMQVRVKTSDRPEFKPESPPQLLVTTPESLDSLITRHPASLRRLSAVMIDELHFLDSRPRGDQLRCLISRLGHIAEVPLQVCAASATLPDPMALATRYLGPEARWVMSHGTPGREGEHQRRIVPSFSEVGDLEDVVGIIAQEFVSQQGCKMLVFANSRADVEFLAAALDRFAQLQGVVFAHHGSIAREERLRVESRFHSTPAAICVATMTLEVGVDIGDVDHVALVGPPANVSSLLQRVGRGSRRQETTRVHCFSFDAFDRKRFDHLLDCAGRGEILEEIMPFRPTVLAQQALSMVFQNPKGWISAQALHSRLPSDVRAAYSEADCRDVLEHMCTQEHFHRMDRGGFAPDSKAMEAHRLGRLHSNIEDVPEIAVFDETTRQRLGSVQIDARQLEDAQQGLSGLNFSLGGKRRELVKMRDGALYVDSEDDNARPNFTPRRGPRYTYELARSFAAHQGIGEDTMVLGARGRGIWRLEHYMGTVWGRLLGWVLGTGSCGPFAASLRSPVPTGYAPFGSPATLYARLDTLLDKERDALARLLDAGPYRRDVPQALLGRWVYEAARVDAFVETLCRMQVLDAPPD